jgi:hypothetical protein
MVEIVQTDNMTAFGQQLAGDVKANKTRRTRHQNCLIRHRIPKAIGPAPPHRPEPLYPAYRWCRNTQLGGYCQMGFKTIPRRRSSARGLELRRF